MSAEARVNIVTMNCKRCQWPFRYVRKPGRGRKRLYCEVCQVLERMDCIQVANEVAKENRHQSKLNAHPA